MNRKTGIAALFAIALAFTANQAHAQTVDISFDGFCDGMHVTLAGDFVYGNRTGCRSQLVLGEFATVIGQPAVVVFFVENNVLFVYTIFLDGGFDVFSWDGFTFGFVGNGTWSFGTPARVSDAISNGTPH